MIFQRENVQGSVSEERKEIEEVLPEVRREDVFDTMIGADGSQKNVIERCKAAVSYPPDGLPILITGESGVGKSFLARLIHQYAVSSAVISESAPLVVLNCADYASGCKTLGIETKTIHCHFPFFGKFVLFAFFDVVHCHEILMIYFSSLCSVLYSV